MVDFAPGDLAGAFLPSKGVGEWWLCRIKTIDVANHKAEVDIGDGKIFEVDLGDLRPRTNNGGSPQQNDTRAQEASMTEREMRQEEIRKQLRNVIALLGLPDEPGLSETPDRVAKFLMEFHSDLEFSDLVNVLKSFEHEDIKHGGMPMVVQTNIPFSALCEHHWAPFFGHVDIGLISNGRVPGLSKLARLCHMAGRRRSTIQERVTNEIADALDHALSPKGVIVVVRATHTCMSCRGINVPGVVTTTSAIRGNYVHVTAARSEFFELCRRGNNA